MSGLFAGTAGGVLQALWLASWKGALVVLLVLAVQTLLARWLPAAWRYALWLLVAVRLLMPTGPPSPLSLFELAGTPSGVPLPTLGGTLGGAAAPPLTPGVAEAGLGAAALVLLVWALGVAFFAARWLVHRRQLRRLLAGAEPVDDAATIALLDRCRARLGVCREVRLLESPALTSPALSPLPPAILLPRAGWRRWSAEDLRFILLHELAHLRQGDGAARRLEALLTALHWFNPLVHLAARRARADREPACDARVLSQLDAGERAGYGLALIRAAERVTQPSPVPGLVGIADNSQQLRRRIEMIARHRLHSPGRFAALTALAVALAVTAWTDTAWTTVADPGSPPEDAVTAAEDQEHQRITIQSTREVGVAMMSWLTDRMIESPCPEAGGTQSEAAADEGSLDWGRCPAITHDELAAILVPTYLEELPATDGWGHPFELCLNLDRTCDPSHILGVRSPGRDGRWQGEVYPVGAFPSAEVDRDVVWIDGYFITWPQAPE